MSIKGVYLKEINKLSRLMREKDKIIYEEIIIYMRLSGLKDIDIEETLIEIGDMIIQSENDNKDINYLIGDNYIQFCDNIINEIKSKYSRFDKIINNFKVQVFLISMAVLFTINYLITQGITLFKDEGFTLNYNLTINQLISNLIISIICYLVFSEIKKDSIKNYKIKSDANFKKIDNKLIKFIILFSMISFAIIITVKTIVPQINLIDTKIYFLVLPFGILYELNEYINEKEYKKRRGIKKELI